jgi:predicted component of type VI protein secretion system
MAKALVLTSISGARLGVRYTLAERTNTIGSAESCTVALSDRSVQSRHAEVRQALDSWFIAPIGGAAVYVNGELVRGQGRLRPNDSLSLGSLGFRVSIEEVTTQERAVGQSPSRTGVPRLGDYLLRQGMLTRTQLDHAIRRQEDLTSQGRRVQLGDVLVQLGYIRQSMLDTVLREQQSDMSDRWLD